MKASKLLVLSILTLVFAVLCVLPSQIQAEKKSKQEKEREKSLKQEKEGKFYKDWLDKDVVYIIMDEERKAFKKLTTDEERDNFIEQFWLRRDPTPDTVENEYKEEHYRRIEYANEHFSSGIPGWKSDRGRIYIMYGKPDEIDSHPSGGSYDRPIEEGGGSTSTYPFEIWRYRYIEDIGNEVMLEFVDTTMSGEYHLTIDPSEKDALLYVPGAGLTQLESMGMASKVDRFNNTDGTHLGKSMMGQPESMNEFSRLELLAKISKPPAVKFKDLEAVVTTKLSYNLLPFEMRSDFIKITNETILTPITLQIENKNLTYVEKDGLHQATVNVFGRITGVNGRIAQTFEQVIDRRIPDSDFQSELVGSSIFQKTFPMRPGLYKIDLVLKDINSGNMGTYTTRLRVPSFDDEKLESSTLILADQIQRIPSKAVGSDQQFVIGSMKVRPKVTELFSRDQHLGIYLQVYNLAIDEKTNRPSVQIEYTITNEKDRSQVLSYVETPDKVEGATAQLTIEKLLPLDSLLPGKYSVQIKVSDNISKQSIVPSASFEVKN
ncbi:MAG: GWxTD domain-containing protein [Acidobacteriia bacterium]|nr:GWxTD domain-containing protein [Terriglobia bacterium]